MCPSVMIGLALFAGPKPAAAFPVGVVARTPAHAVWFPPRSHLFITPDAKHISDGTTWVDLTAEAACDPPVKLPKLEEGRGFDLLDTGDVVAWNPGKYVLFDGRSGKEKASFSAQGRCDVAPTGTRIERTVEAKNAGKALTSLQAATWPKAGEEPEWVTLATEDGRVYVEAFNRTGSHLYWEVYVGTSTDRVFRVHDFATGTTATLEGEAHRYALSPNGKVAGGVGRNAVLLCDTATGRMTRSFPLTPAEKQRFYKAECLFTADDRYLLVWKLAYNRLDLFPTDPKEDRRSIDLSPGDGVKHLWATPDGKRVVVVDSTGVVRIYDITTGKAVNREKDRPTWKGVRWLADGSLLTWSHNGTAALWDADTLKQKKAFTLGPLSTAHWGIADVVLSPDRTRLVVDEKLPEESDGLGHRFRILDAATGKKLLELPDTFKAPWCAFHPDGRTVWVPTYDTIDKESGGAGDHLRIYDLTTGENRTADQLPARYPFGFCSDGRSALMRNWEDHDHVRWVDARTGEPRWETEYHLVKNQSARIDGSPNRFTDDPKAGTAVVVVNARVTVYDLLSGKDRTPPGLDFYGCALTPDARWVLGAKPSPVDDRRPVLSLTDLRAKPGEKGDRQFADVPLDEWPYSMDLSPDATRAATLEADGVLTVWDLNKLRTVPPQVPKERDTWAELLTETHGPAMQALHADPVAALKLFADKVRPVPVPDAKVVAQRIGELGSRDFNTRDAAEKWLGDVCEAIRPALNAAAVKATSPEAGERLTRLLEKAEAAADLPEFVRTVRAVEVVERIGTPEAVKVLERWAGGAPGAALTTEAADSLKRLKAR